MQFYMEAFCCYAYIAIMCLFVLTTSEQVLTLAI